MTTARGKALALAAAGGMVAAVTGCGAASTAPSVPTPMPEYPPLDRPAANAGTARTSAAATLVAKPAANGEGEGNGDEELEDLMISRAPKAAVARPRRPKNCCKGTNDCKGKGYCKTAKNACKGRNDCKGQGGCKPVVCP